MSIQRKIEVQLGKFEGALKHPKKEPLQGKDAAAKKLREVSAAMPEMSTEGLSQAGAKWANHSNEFRMHCTTKDPARFLRWKVVRGTMFVDASKFLAVEYDYLSSLPDFESRWATAFMESWVGGPPRFWMDGRTSGNRMHLTYHLARFEQATGVDLTSYDSIVEFGGGYGCMCDTIHRLGFKGRYVIRDMPFQSALQEYYLERNGRKIVPPAESGNGVSLVSTDEEFEAVLGQLGEKRLFVATWSLSETPLDYRAQTEELTRPFEGCLIGFQHNFENVENVQYFNEWREHRQHLEFSLSPIEHLPGSSYLFGFSQ